VPDFQVRARDEIGTLADSFNRMKKSLVQAMKMLEE
jgi:protein-histidine pros-kinase